MRTPIALTIAGSDPSGAAGIQADLKTFHRFGAYGQAVISLLTVQNGRGVFEVEPVRSELVVAQLVALLDELPPQAIKTGALASAGTMRAIAEQLRERGLPLIVDPVLRPTVGAPFSSDDMARAYLEVLAPSALLLTPNAVEATQLSGIEVVDERSATAAAEHLLRYGMRAVLVKGGHLTGEPVDVLVTAAGERFAYRSVRVETPHTRGTGCTYAAAITALLARGLALPDAVSEARAWLARVLATPLSFDSPRGPLNHFIPPTGR
jgi:hydroxymethylpyrimidine/phosphomethylpyrimidine kinase